MSPEVAKIVRESVLPADPIGTKIGRIMAQLRARFVEERTSGTYLHPKTLEPIPKVSPEEAERRWQAIAHRYEELLRADPELVNEWTS